MVLLESTDHALWAWLAYGGRVTKVRVSTLDEEVFQAPALSNPMLLFILPRVIGTGSVILQRHRHRSQKSGLEICIVRDDGVLERSIKIAFIVGRIESVDTDYDILRNIVLARVKFIQFLCKLQLLGVSIAWRSPNL